jgi:hypothetical protein
MKTAPCPAERPVGMPRVTWWRARKRGYITIDYHHRLAQSDRAVLALLRRLLGPDGKRVSHDMTSTALAAALGYPPRRVRRWLQPGGTTPPEELMPAVKKWCAAALEQLTSTGHPSGCSDYTLRAARGIVLTED